MTRSELEIIIKRRAALWVTALAALLAINGWIGGSNSSKITSSTIQANNHWAWYQAKNVRTVVYQTTADTIQDQKLRQHYLAEVQRLRVEMDGLSEEARRIEAERTNAQKRSPYYTYAGIALQLGIVLSTAAILAVAMPLFYGSIGVGAVGAVMFMVAQYGV